VIFLITARKEQGTSGLVDPGINTTITYTNTADPAIQTRIEVPAGAVNRVTQLTYVEILSNPEKKPQGFLFGGRHFAISAYINGQLQSGFTFAVPVKLEISFSEKFPDIHAKTFELRSWDPLKKEWSTDGITVISWDLVHHRVVVEITHLTEFALFARGCELKGCQKKGD
jgi:hypothetical protein